MISFSGRSKRLALFLLVPLLAGCVDGGSRRGGYYPQPERPRYDWNRPQARPDRSDWDRQRPDRDRPQRPERPDWNRPDRSHQPDRPDRADRPDRRDRNDFDRRGRPNDNCRREDRRDCR